MFIVATYDLAMDEVTETEVDLTEEQARALKAAGVVIRNTSEPRPSKQREPRRSTDNMAYSTSTGANRGVQVGMADVMGLSAALNAKPLEPSALGLLTKRLHSQVVAAQSIENEVESITRRLGGSVPVGGVEAMQDANAQIQPPRLDELNGLVDLLSQSLARTDAEVQRLRRMVD